MNIDFLIILVFFLLLVGLGVYGIVSRERSLLVGLLSLVLAALAGLGSWYAAMETQSLPWTLGYGALALIGTVSAVRNFLPRPS